jgi:GTP1/Obg family GTP-binding protein
MKSALIFFLIGLVIILGFNISVLRKNLRDTAKHAEFIEEGNNKLRMELARMMKINNGNEQLLNELSQSLEEFNSKAPFESIKKYIPGKMWKGIKPIIDRLQAFQEAREKKT